MRRAVLDLQLGLENSELIYRSLEPELKRDNIQTRVEITIDGGTFKLEIEASELSTLRAALNSYIRWINCINSINNVIEKDK